MAETQAAIPATRGKGPVLSSPMIGDRRSYELR